MRQHRAIASVCEDKKTVRRTVPVRAVQAHAQTHTLVQPAPLGMVEASQPLSNRTLPHAERLHLLANMAHLHGNRAIQRWQQSQGNAALSGTDSTVQRRGRDETPAAIGYVGLNPQAGREARALKRAAQERVIVSLDRPKRQELLKTAEGMDEFIVNGLGIRPEQNAQHYDDAMHCLEACDPRFRDQMADLMEMFHAAETGKYRLERLVLSGHHSGGTLWRGRPPDIFQTEAILSLRQDLSNLVKIFPEASEQVEDIMFSACNSTTQIDLCRALFPNLRSIWAYAGSSPTIGQGSERHITSWERKTRGERTPSPKLRMGHVLVWTSEGAGG